MLQDLDSNSHEFNVLIIPSWSSIFEVFLIKFINTINDDVRNNNFQW